MTRNPLTDKYPIHYPPALRKAVRETLMRAARRANAAGGGYLHPAMALASLRCAPWRRAAAWKRFCDVVGVAEFEATPEGTIDMLVAAAMWEDR